MKMYVGIDEVGRGPLAGPVCVGVFCCDRTTLKWILKHAPCKITDSKKMTAKNRVAVVAFLKNNKCFTGDQHGQILASKSSRVPQGAETPAQIFPQVSARAGSSHLDYCYAVGYSSASYIDKHGIVAGIRRAMMQAVRRAGATTADVFLLDGGLRLPADYPHQTTIIKGDAKEPLISLASIIAKESRDSYMKKLSKKHPDYGFERHVGYGTRAHYAAINRKGVLKGVHRQSFIR